MTRSDIDALNARFAEAFEKGDAALIAPVYAQDARVMPPGAPTVEGSGIQQFWQSAMDAGITGCTLKTVSLEEHGDVAIEVGQYELRGEADVVDTGKYVVVHRQQGDGQWRLGIDIWNSDQAAQAG